MGVRAAIGRAWVVSTTVGVAGVPRDVQRAILGANHFFVLGSVVAVPWAVTLALHSSERQPYPAVTHGLLIVAWMTCVWMNSRGLHVLAPALGLTVASAQYTYLSHLYGRDSGFHLAILAIPTLAFVMFDRRHRVMRLVATAVAGVTCAVIYVGPRFAEPLVDVSDAWMRGVAVANVVSAMVIFATVALYNDFYLRQERRRADILLAEAQVAADTDALTGLLNRRGVAPVLLGAPDDGPYALLLIDVDRFKRVNDELGHAAGDRVLATVADALREGKGADGALARWGGEEFLIVLPDAWPGRVSRLAESLRRDVEELTDPSTSVRVTVSVGAAVAAAGTPFEEVLRVADACLYEAKAGGRNLAVVREVAA